jgi:predicted DNA-binding mobile mystery protein A
MSRFSTARSARRVLDARLSTVDMGALSPPRTGWVAGVRAALQISASDLGARLNVTRQSIAALEASERAGTVRMSTLAAAAAALDCTLVYAFIPNTSLEGTVQMEAARIVEVFAAQTAHTMTLENQAVPLTPADRQDAIDDVIRSGRLLWRTDLG